MDTRFTVPFRNRQNTWHIPVMCFTLPYTSYVYHNCKMLASWKGLTNSINVHEASNVSSTNLTKPSPRRGFNGGGFTGIPHWQIFRGHKPFVTPPPPHHFIWGNLKKLSDVINRHQKHQPDLQRVVHTTSESRTYYFRESYILLSSESRTYYYLQRVVHTTIFRESYILLSSESRTYYYLQRVVHTTIFGESYILLSSESRTYYYLQRVVHTTMRETIHIHRFFDDGFIRHY